MLVKVSREVWGEGECELCEWRRYAESFRDIMQVLLVYVLQDVYILETFTKITTIVEF